MGLVIKSEHLNGLIVFEQKIFSDERGFFMETFRADEFEKFGLPTNFLQDNHSRSRRGVLRGMHFQWDEPMGKLIHVTLGNAYVVEIDIRPGSPTFGKWFGIELSDENRFQLWVPAGFANGFYSISDWVEMQYKCTAVWNPKGESRILWNDPEVGINWNVIDPVISEKDKIAQTLKSWLGNPNSESFRYK